jgi:hypothetical protein
LTGKDEEKKEMKKETPQANYFSSIKQHTKLQEPMAVAKQ